MENLGDLERKIGLRFINPQLGKQAFVHSSYAHEHPSLGLLDNERLEFLGDSILGFLIAEEIYVRHSLLTEGEMSLFRASLVNASALAAKAEQLDLGRHLLLGRGEELVSKRKRRALLASVFEALVGAIYLDQGIEIVKDWLVGLFDADLVEFRAEQIKSYKSLLQERLQKKFQARPLYRLVSEMGPDHNKIFFVRALFKGEVIGEGEGKNKREAEERAAKAALEGLKPPVSGEVEQL